MAQKTGIAGVIAPPSLIYLGFLVAGLLLDANLPIAPLPMPWWRYDAAIALGVLALTFAGPITPLLLVPLVLIIRYAVIAREERYLEARFGETYRLYQTRIRRWF